MVVLTSLARFKAAIRIWENAGGFGQSSRASGLRHRARQSIIRVVFNAGSFDCAVVGNNVL